VFVRNGIQVPRPSFRAKSRNLAGNCEGLSVRDQIPPLRDASHHSGRNDNMQRLLFRAVVHVFLSREAEESVKKNPAKRLNYDHPRRTRFPILK